MIALDQTMIPTSFARLIDDIAFGRDIEVRFWVIAFRTQNKLANESIKQILKLGGLMRTIHNESIVFEIELRLRSQLTAKVLCRI